MVDQVGWVPESHYRRAVGLLRGWVTALAILVLIGVLILGALLFRWMFEVKPFPVVVSSPSDCRLGGDAQSPKLYVAVDVGMIASGSLASASSVGPSEWDVEAAGLVPSVAGFSSLTDGELSRLIERADQDHFSLTEKDPTGVVLAMLDTDGESSGHLDGLRVEWVMGEPVHEQDLPLGIEFTPTSCTVTTTR
jgi:hypothetical protein